MKRVSNQDKLKVEGKRRRQCADDIIWMMKQAREIRRLVLKLDQKICSESDQTAAVFPSQKATVITGRGRHLEAEQMIWGFPRFDGKGILINARAETAMERHTFKESVLHRRCVIPAKGFWEWNRSKEKFSFERTDSQVLFMAGCYDCIDWAEPFRDPDYRGKFLCKAGP